MNRFREQVFDISVWTMHIIFTVTPLYTAFVIYSHGVVTYVELGALVLNFGLFLFMTTGLVFFKDDLKSEMLKDEA